MAYEPHRSPYGLVKAGVKKSLGASAPVSVVPKEATDADFFEVISKLDVRNVHELCALACVTLQRDGGPSNLMLQQVESCLQHPAVFSSDLLSFTEISVPAPSHCTTDTSG